MKKILILYPHFPPSNLAGVHRPRLFAQHLPAFGWEPVILTVHEDYYEEAPDWNLVKLLPQNLRIEKVKAFKLTRPRLVGDIGLRAFFQLYRKAKQLIQNEGFDFLYIPIPSFYGALLGRWLHGSTGIRYGIDYIDPWVHAFPGAEKIFNRHWVSSNIAKLLEPIAVKKASLITGVAAGYYEAVLQRSPHLRTQAVIAAMPYGGEQKDHAWVANSRQVPYLFRKEAHIFKLVYAGAMLPKAYGVLAAIFAAIQQHRAIFHNIQFHFIGTGKTPDDAIGYNIKALAEKYELWQTVVFEYPKRIPYLDVLLHLNLADGIFILGSTEPHYTPSKTYQAVLSGKPILAILHEASSAASIIEQAGAGMLLTFSGEVDVQKVEEEFVDTIQQFQSFVTNFDPAAVDASIFNAYSAKNVTGQLAHALDTIITKPAAKITNE